MLKIKTNSIPGLQEYMNVALMDILELWMM
jgi:hypothetical protein